MGKRVREAGMTHVSHQAYPGRDTYRFSKEPKDKHAQGRAAGRGGASLSSDEHRTRGK
ncbi:hypothetical protein ACU686_05040 [Yinghuangia aomiensis]